MARFGSAPRTVPAGFEIKLFGSAGSVRPVRFGFLFLPENLALFTAPFLTALPEQAPPMDTYNEMLEHDPLATQTERRECCA